MNKNNLLAFIFTHLRAVQIQQSILVKKNVPNKNQKTMEATIAGFACFLGKTTVQRSVIEEHDTSLNVAAKRLESTELDTNFDKSELSKRKIEWFDVSEVSITSKRSYLTIKATKVLSDK